MRSFYQSICLTKSSIFLSCLWLVIAVEGAIMNTSRTFKNFDHTTHRRNEISTRTPQFCRIVHQLEGNTDITTNIFSTISYDEGAAEILSRLNNEIRGTYSKFKACAFFSDLPGQLIQYNKLELSSYLISMGLEETDVYLYALRFLHDVEELYQSSPPKVTLQVVESKMEKLLLSIVMHASSGNNIGYSSDDLTKCLRTSDLALETLFVFSDGRTLKWYQNFILGLGNYYQMKKVIEMAGSFLALGPSQSCQDSLNRLARGCYPNQQSSEMTICAEFCVNVIRGCLAPPFLFLPSRAMRHNQSISWYHIIEQSRFRQQNWVTSTMDLMMRSLNYTFVLEMIQAGLNEVNQNAALLKVRLQTLCGDPKQKPTSPTTSTTTKPGQIMRMPDTEQLESRRQKLTESMNQLSDKLHRIALKFANTQALLKSVEQYYCYLSESIPSKSESNQCWNGTAYARYHRNISAFTEIGQLNNPEVTIDEASLHLRPPIQQITSDFAKTGHANQIQDPSLLILQNREAILNNVRQYESSGLMPPNTDIDPLPQLIPNVYPTQDGQPTFNKPDQDSSNVMIENGAQHRILKGCTPDDEDCDLGANESVVVPSSVSKAVQNELDQSRNEIDFTQVAPNTQTSTDSGFTQANTLPPGQLTIKKPKENSGIKFSRGPLIWISLTSYLIAFLLQF